MRGGIWRYHPGLKRFEALVHGTTNPWGHDWNALGELFFINTTNGHLWHMIPGAHFARPHTIEPNPRAYAIIDQHADHYHWDNSREMTYPFIPTGEDARRGGGHAHSGLLIYQADQWPRSYRDKLLTLNFHGRRMNVERLERSGSGYVGRHEPDAFFASDPWFRGIDLSRARRQRLRPRLERYRGMPRARRGAQVLGADLSDQLRQGCTGRAGRRFAARPARARGDAPLE